MSVLEHIQGHGDLLFLNDEDRAQLCAEIRVFLVNHVACTGGHLASNLGVVELTVALETVFNTQRDRLVFDVGHQSYVHKLLTGRMDRFDSLRQYGGLSGFPKPHESDTDAFVAGHASSSVSVALGMARARTLLQKDYRVVALIGDGATTGGLAYEGLNDAGDSGEPLLVILNDNEMSIDRNVGAVSRHLYKLRVKESYLGAKRRYRALAERLPGGQPVYRLTRAIKDRIRRSIIPTTIFEEMGFTYLGPVDGHDLPGLLSVLRIARDMNRPVLLHVLTRKGYGYTPAEEHPSKFHGVGQFEPETGVVMRNSHLSFSDTFGKTMIELAEKDDRICAITAAMPGGTGLLEFRDAFPKRLFDVGIAEGHAVSMAGGLAKQGMVPVVAIYSTFLQRSFDMLLQDVAMQRLHVVFAVDRAGLVGEDGPTHHGVFDVGYLRQVPGMMILCPVSHAELRDMLIWAAEDYEGPVALRYPRGGGSYTQSDWQLREKLGERGLLCQHRAGSDAALICYGTMLEQVMAAAQTLREQGIEASVIRLLTVSPLPVQEIVHILGSCRCCIVVEEVCAGSGICDALNRSLSQAIPGCTVAGLDLGWDFPVQGEMDRLYAHYGLDAAGIAAYTREVLDREK